MLVSLLILLLVFAIIFTIIYYLPLEAIGPFPIKTILYLVAAVVLIYILITRYT